MTKRLLSTVDIVKRKGLTYPFVDFSTVEDYAKQHPRASRYVAHPFAHRRRRKTLIGVLFKGLCKATGVVTYNGVRFRATMHNKY